MTNLIRIYTMNTFEFKRLSDFAEICSARSPLNYQYYVNDCLFDAGQNWCWTTIIAEKPNDDSFFNTWQAISPRDLEAILNPETNLQDFYNIWWNNKFNSEHNTIERNK